MKTFSQLLDTATDEDLDRLSEMLDFRRSERDQEAEDEYRRNQEEQDAKKYCQKCESYLSCRERKKGKCDSCGARQHHR